MSIASEFDSTIENIKSDYEGLENIGADLTNIDKNIYNIRTCLDNIYSNLPKTTGEGSNLSLTTLKGRINVDDILGDTEQETYEGYNLLVYPYKYQNGNGTTLDKNVENDLEITGNTTTSGMAHFYLINAVELKANTTYTITRTIEALSGTTVSSTGQIELYIGTTWKKAVLFQNQTSATFTVDDNATYRIVVKLGSLSETSKFKISNFMIYEGTGTKPFEKYVGGTASPNPTYPQDINVVTGTQEVVVQNKNILKFTQTKTATSGGITATCNDNTTITINGTSSSMVTMAFEIDAKLLNGTYKLSGYTRNDTYLQLYTKNSSGTIRAINMKDTPSISFSNETLYQVFIFVANGVTATFNNETFNLQLEKGSTATPYTPHQEQTKTLHLSSRNLCFTDPSEWTLGQYDMRGNIDNNAVQRARLKDLLPVPENKVLYFHTNNSNYNLVVRGYDENKQFISSFGGISNGGTTTTQVSGTDIAYLGITIYSIMGESSTTGQDILDKITSGDIKPFICLNTETDKTYEPYYNYELAKIGTYQDRIFETSGKNLFNPDVTSLYKAGCNVTESGGEITITATQNGDIYVGNVRASGGTYVTDRGVKIPVAPLTSYILSLTNSNVNKLFITEYDSNNISLGYVQANTITTQANTSYITIRYGLENATSGTSYKTKIMLNLGSTALPYEPYGSDKWYIEKNIRKLILNGSEAWNTARGTSPYVYTVAVSNYMRTNEVICMSNYFKGVANGTYGSMTNNEIKFRYYVSDTNKDMYICSSDFTTLADFKTWLGTHNTEVYYVLETPTYEEITNTTLIEELNELEKMMSYNGQTNISVTGSLPMILNVSALKGE